MHNLIFWINKFFNNIIFWLFFIEIIWSRIDVPYIKYIYGKTPTSTIAATIVATATTIGQVPTLHDIPHELLLRPRQLEVLSPRPPLHLSGLDLDAPVRDED